tara:strand:+ start:466 stop:774 length:309 start_codon:yes stop_codon:yes gene_type:complete
MIYPEHTKILLHDASKKNVKRGGRPKGDIPLKRNCDFKIRVTQYEHDIISLASHILQEDYHSIMVNPAMQYAVRRLLEEGVDIPTSAPPAPNPPQAKPSNAK